MSTATVHPGVAHGSARAPPSKSYTHRALVAAHLAHRPFDVVRPLVADDTRATARGLHALGSLVDVNDQRWRLSPSSHPVQRPRVRCGNSGTTLRFLTAVAAAQAQPVWFEGGAQLSARPIAGLAESLRASGVEVTVAGARTLPMKVRGPLQPGQLHVDGSVSSQYVSALLLVLPTLAGPSTLSVDGERVSEPYIASTAAVLRSLGVRLNGGDGRWKVPAPQAVTGRRFEVPGDASSAAYLWAAAAVTGGQVALRGIPGRWPQADRLILELLGQAGARVRESADGARVSGPVETPFDIDLTGAPDLYPLAGAIAALIPGPSTIRGAAHVVFKESDRRAATIRLVQDLGGRAMFRGGRLRIHGTRHPRAIRMRPSDDHRVVMSAAVAALRADGPSRIGDARAVRKSFPGFWSALRGLGVRAGVQP
jgi:3-phosphoshikimate 1-carboxyvinyltransferase